MSVLGAAFSRGLHLFATRRAAGTAACVALAALLAACGGSRLGPMAALESEAVTLGDNEVMHRRILHQISTYPLNLANPSLDHAYTASTD